MLRVPIKNLPLVTKLEVDTTAVKTHTSFRRLLFIQSFFMFQKKVQRSLVDVYILKVALLRAADTF